MVAMQAAGYQRLRNGGTYMRLDVCLRHSQSNTRFSHETRRFCNEMKSEKSSENDSDSDIDFHA